MKCAIAAFFVCLIFITGCFSGGGGPSSKNPLGSADTPPADTGFTDTLPDESETTTGTVPSSFLIKSVDLAFVGELTAGIPERVDFILTHEGGGYSTDADLVFFKSADPDVMLVDAKGWIYFLDKDKSAGVLAGAIGKTPDNLPDAKEEWQQVVVSPTLTIYSDNINPVDLVIKLDGDCNLSMKERRTVTILDLETGQDVTNQVIAGGGLSLDDSSKARFIPDTNGVYRIVEGRNVGFWKVNANHNGKTVTINCRTLPGNPWICKYVKGGSIGVYDTHLRFSRPFQDGGNNDWYIPILCNLSSNLFQQTDKPVWFGPPDWANSDPMPELEIFYDAAGTKWGVYLFGFNGDSGDYDVAPSHYVGRWASPIVESEFSDPSLWSWPWDIEKSRWHDLHDGGGQDFLFTIRRNSDPDSVEIVARDIP